MDDLRISLPLLETKDTSFSNAVVVPVDSTEFQSHQNINLILNSSSNMICASHLNGMRPQTEFVDNNLKPIITGDYG